MVPDPDGAKKAGGLMSRHGYKARPKLQPKRCEKSDGPIVAMNRRRTKTSGPAKAGGEIRAKGPEEVKARSDQLMPRVRMAWTDAPEGKTCWVMPRIRPVVG
jgi:hypothetical protein